MRRLSVILFLCLCVTNLNAFPTVSGGVYLITKTEDLGGATLRLQKGAVVRIEGGMIRNGTLQGSGNRLVVVGKGAGLDRVSLTGEWAGTLSDQAFVYRKDDDHYPIVSSLFRFNEAVFSRKAYWLKTWEPVIVNRTSLEVFGNGVTFYVTSDKGPLTLSSWAPRYTKEALFATMLTPGGNLSYAFHDIEIQDNADEIGRAGWGYDVSQFRIYSYFGIMGRKILFDHIRTDGGGALEKIYNIGQPIDSLVFRGCSAKTVQFAVEVMNDRRDTDYSCGQIRFEDCSFTQYACQCFCGLVSVVGAIPTESVVFRDCLLDARAQDGNLELTSALRVDMRGCTLWNTFLQSEAENGTETYTCVGNDFNFSVHQGVRAYEFSGKQFEFRDNRLTYHTARPGYITSRGGVDELCIAGNVVDCSGVERLSESPILISITDLVAKGGTRVTMEDNRVLNRPREGNRRFQIYMPYVYSAYSGNSGSDLASVGFARNLAPVTSARVTHRNYDTFAEKVFTISTEGTVRGQGKEEIWYFTAGNARYALSLEDASLVLRQGRKKVLTVPAASGVLDVTFSAQDRSSWQVWARLDGNLIGDARFAGRSSAAVEFVFVNRGSAYRVQSSGFQRGGIVIEN